jgi:pyridoxamine 5'-phosphate oxidase family protein
MSDIRTGFYAPEERAYILGQELGRLATIGPDGTPHVRPVCFRFNPADGSIDIGGPRLAASRKYRNVLADARAAFVIDDVAPEDSGAPKPGRGRGIEIRGVAEALAGEPRVLPYYSDEVIRIRPRRLITWNLSAERPDVHGRDVP